MNRLVLASALVAVAAFAGCSGTHDEVANRLEAADIAASVMAAMDTSADPCDDFYQYACGGWLATTEIPADQARWTRMSELNERNLERLRDMLADLAANPEADPATAKLGQFYGSCMDEAAVEEQGAAPLVPWIDAIVDVNDKNAFMKMVGKMQANGVNALFDAEVEADLKNPEINIVHFFQGGLSLPDRDYYLSDDDTFVQHREDFLAHVSRMLVMFGETEEDANAQAKTILKFETALANVSWPRQDLRDPVKIYNKLDLDGLEKLAPELSWSAMLEGVGKPEIREINVGTPPFFEALPSIVDEAGPAAWRAYLQWQLLTNAAPRLSGNFANEDFEFFGKTLQGRKEIQPRWKRCVSATDRALGEMLGQAFVDRYFAGDSKTIALNMIQSIETGFEQNLPGLTWMDDVTRERAAEKMHMVDNMIGYPDEWRDYSAMEVSVQSYYANSQAATRFEVNRLLDKIGQPVDKGEWGMSPPTVNAYYHPLRNQMVFPAGILQEPAFHRDFPMAMNLGAIGMVMGHELTHGFDDSGRQFDGHGQLTEWWEPEASAKYEQAAECVDDLYDSYEVRPGLNVNGKLTLGENIADLGGVKQAYSALKNWETANGADEPIVEGLNNDQLFFVAYSQLWCAKATEQIEQMLIKTDPHSPPKFRVVGPLTQYDAFAQAFSCEPGTAMSPVDRCEVW